MEHIEEAGIHSGDSACALPPYSLPADLVDEVGLNVHPVLLGAGVPLFRDPGRRVPLALTRARISKAMPGLDAVPVIWSVELSKQATVGVGIPGSASTE